MTELARTGSVEVAPLAEADLHRRRADAAVLVARKALVADEQLVPLLRERGDAWREWGLLLGPAEKGAPEGNQNAKNNVTVRHVDSDADRKARERARKIAAVHEAEYLAWRDSPDPDTLTLASLLRIETRRARQHAVREHRHETAGAVDVDLMDACDFLRGLGEPADLLLTDPPYSTDVEDIYGFARSWVPLALDALKPTGRAYIFIGAYARELHAYLDVVLDQERFVVEPPLVWTYRNTLGPTPAYGYKLNWQAILHLRGPEAPPLAGDEMVERFTVQDVSAPDGRHNGRLHAWQKPDELAERLILHSTGAGQLVIDPFAGTGTFALAASRLGRRSRAAEIDPQMLAIWRQVAA